MIVHYEEEGWKVITQRAHGILAGQFARHWHFDKIPKRMTELQLAIAEHDDAEIELHGENLLTAQGGPLNFDMKTFELAHCKKLSDFSLTKSRYIALLTSMHMDFLYEKDAAHDKEAKAFLAEQKKIRSRLLKELNITRQQAEKDYALLEWCDALSLLLCQDMIPPEQRSVEISSGPEKIQYLLHQSKSEKLSVTPWPFSSDEFEVYIEYRLLPQVKFTSSAAFRKAFYAAEVCEKHWTFARSAD